MSYKSKSNNFCCCKVSGARNKRTPMLLDLLEDDILQIIAFSMAIEEFTTSILNKLKELEDHKEKYPPKNSRFKAFSGPSVPSHPKKQSRDNKHKRKGQFKSPPTLVAAAENSTSSRQTIVSDPDVDEQAERFRRFLIDDHVVPSSTRRTSQ